MTNEEESEEDFWRRIATDALNRYELKERYKLASELAAEREMHKATLRLLHEASKTTESSPPNENIRRIKRSEVSTDHLVAHPDHPEGWAPVVRVDQDHGGYFNLDLSDNTHAAYSCFGTNGELPVLVKDKPKPANAVECVAEVLAAESLPVGAQRQTDGSVSDYPNGISRRIVQALERDGWLIGLAHER